MDPHSRAPKKNTSHGNEVLPQYTMHLIQRPRYQRGIPCQDPARPSGDLLRETQTVVVWTRLPFTKSSKTILQAKVKRGGRQQRKRWEDNIREWTGLEFAKSQPAVQNRERLVVKTKPLHNVKVFIFTWWHNTEIRPTPSVALFKQYVRIKKSVVQHKFEHTI